MHKIKRPTFKNVVKQLPDEHKDCNAGDYNVTQKFHGEKVTVGILGTGMPIHKDIDSIEDFEVFYEAISSPDDIFGNTTLVSGLINAKSSSGLTGFAPYSKTYIAKVADDEGNLSVDAFIAGMIWLTVKEVDLIVIPCKFKVRNKSNALKRIIEKSYSENIPLLAPYDRTKPTDDASAFPIDYPEILLVNHGKKEKASNMINLRLQDNTYTTSLNNEYLKTKGQEAAMGVAGGLTTVIISKYKKQDKDYSAKSIYAELIKTVEKK